MSTLTEVPKNTFSSSIAMICLSLATSIDFAACALKIRATRIIEVRHLSRMGLLGTTISLLCAFLLSSARSALAGPDDCSGSNPITCSGDQSEGISISLTNPPSVVSTLNVLNLTTDINPAAQTGIRLSGQGASGGRGDSGAGIGEDGRPGKPGTAMTTSFKGGVWEILTQGDATHGMQVESVGGDGGQGGNSDCTRLFGVCIAGPLTGLGGDGGRGGDGGAASVSSNGALSTSGDNSHGVFVISQGGDGGRGGDVYNVGGGNAGDGGKAGSGGLVIVNSSSAITVFGAESHGIFVQSLGGLGGNGGEVQGLVGKSGAGKDAGHGGEIEVNNFGAIETGGLDSRGIFAQSIGGFDENTGGGGGGSATGLFVIGGSAGSGGAGGAVTVNNSSRVTTHAGRATAILAESIGGGGGSGGSAISAAPFLSLAWGGEGGAGGHGGPVMVDNRKGPVGTMGDHSHGIQASSIGGGGGNGGIAISAAVGSKFAISLAKGGDGERGGDGGAVTVLSNSGITTRGTDASGISAESIGGGGGSGGSAISFAGSKGFSVAFSVGGSGDEGGSGAAVCVGDQLDPILGVITTSGDGSTGIHAMSVGGGGGSGGLSISTAVSLTGPAAVAVGIGGSGGDGGAGGAVSVVSQADITTSGENAYGIRAQSTSDGGGDGGFALAGAGSFGGAPKNFSLAVGGKGGKGGAAGVVDVDSAGMVTTLGNGSHGIFATSIGGTGGIGGSSVSSGLGFGGSTWNFSLSIGGDGGEGGAGGNVRAGNLGTPLSGKIRTEGNEAHGIFAQSIGGGGGEGGSSALFTLDSDLQLKDKNTVVTLTGALGGKGGAGNIGGNVDINNDSFIETLGDISHGVFAQSIGGGGGSGGSAEAINLSTSSLLELGGLETEHWGFNLSAGGDGGDANKGGQVQVVNRGSIATEGILSRGIFAQSVGGGGGSVANGIEGKAGEWIEKLEGVEKVLSALEVAEKLYQAISEPSSLIPKSLSVTVGADGGDSADADLVSIDNTGDINTKGLEAHAIFAQSIGGGGGEAQAYAKGEGKGEKDVGVGIGLLGQLAIGGAGGAAGNGGVVSITHSGKITTWGEAAYGIYSQSIGGGGGQAGSIKGGFADPDSIGIGVAFGRDGGSGGDGDEVAVVSSGEIFTHGAGGVGIFAQSIGGGGGILGAADGIAFAGSIGGFGSAGEVTVTHTGNIVTSGDVAHGIFAQSGAGLAGDLTRLVEIAPGFPPVPVIVETYAGESSDTNITLSGNIITQGRDSVGILAQSRGEGGAGDIVIKIDSGSVRGGSGKGVGVLFLDGKDNMLVNRGSVSAMSGNAIIGGDANETVDNYGTVTGNVQLGAGANAFTNHIGAVFNTGATIDLGTGRLLTNSGSVAPGGVGAEQVTRLSGDYVQASGGVLAIDLNLQHDMGDRLEVSGDAQIDGQLAVRPIGGRARPGSHEQRFLSAAGGITDNGIVLNAPPSAVVSYGSLQVETTEIKVLSEVDFSPKRSGALSSNARHVAEHVNAIQSAGGSDSFAPIAAALVDMPDDPSLNAAYEGLIPESLGNLATETAAASVAFNDAMHSCRQREGEYRFVSEGECRWARVEGLTRDQNKTSDNPGYQLDTFAIAGGVQQEIATDTHFGYGLSFQHADLDSSLTDSDGNQVEGALILKRRYDAVMVSGSVSAGYGWYDTDRDVGLSAPSVSASSDQDIFFGSIHGRVSRDFEQGSNRYVRPLVDLGVTQVHRKSFSERGAGGANLDVDSEDDTFWTIQPAIEFGGEFQRDSGTLLRPYARIGATHYLTDNKRQITASLQGSPASVAPFTIETESDRTYADLSLGVDVMKKNGASLRLEYTGQFSDHSSSHAAGLKLYVPF